MFTEDMTPFFDSANGFAQPVLFGGVTSVDCVFDNAYLEQLGAAAATPVLTAPTALVSGFGRGTLAVVAGINYTVVSNEPDGTGISSLQLRT